MMYGHRYQPHDHAQAGRGGDAQSEGDDCQGHPGADTAQYPVLAPPGDAGVTGPEGPPGCGCATAGDRTGSVL